MFECSLSSWQGYRIWRGASFPVPVIPLVAGIQKRSFWRNAPQLLAALGLEKTYWIPAFAGMTAGYRLE
jgi:hypothetical protein